METVSNYTPKKMSRPTPSTEEFMRRRRVIPERRSTSARSIGGGGQSPRPYWDTQEVEDFAFTTPVAPIGGVGASREITNRASESNQMNSVSLESWLAPPLTTSSNYHAFSTGESSGGAFGAEGQQALNRHDPSIEHVATVHGALPVNNLFGPDDGSFNDSMSDITYQEPEQALDPETRTPSMPGDNSEAAPHDPNTGNDQLGQNAITQGPISGHDATTTPLTPPAPITNYSGTGTHGAASGPAGATAPSSADEMYTLTTPFQPSLMDIAPAADMPIPPMQSSSLTVKTPWSGPYWNRGVKPVFA